MDSLRTSGPNRPRRHLRVAPETRPIRNRLHTPQDVLRIVRQALLVRRSHLVCNMACPVLIPTFQAPTTSYKDLVTTMKIFQILDLANFLRPIPGLHDLPSLLTVASHAVLTAFLGHVKEMGLIMKEFPDNVHAQVAMARLGEKFDLGLTFLG